MSGAEQTARGTAAKLLAGDPNAGRETAWRRALAPILMALVPIVVGRTLPGGSLDGAAVPLLSGPLPAIVSVLAVVVTASLLLLEGRGPAARGGAQVAGGFLVGLSLLLALNTGLIFAPGQPFAGLLLVAGAIGLIWQGMAAWSRVPDRWARLAVPLLFGGLMVYAWEVLCRGFEVPRILLPPPTLILTALIDHAGMFAIDFNQTVIRAVVPGYIAGCAIGFLTAVAIDRSPFLQRGLLPIGSLVSAMPIVGIAPIMVMWFGFDWQSKAAVVIVMTFFPMMVNTLAGLQSAGAMERDLMRSYAATYGQTLVKLRLPGAMPFIFNALKLNSTLALIGAIVAEFFGTPIYGMGFRISTEVGRLNVDMVWATIAVAAVAGSAFYGGLALVERWATAWHPSQRERG